MLKKIRICQLSPMLDTNTSYNEAEMRCPYLLLSCWDKTLTRSNLGRKELISSYSATQQLDIRETPGRSLSAGTEAGSTERSYWHTSHYYAAWVLNETTVSVYRRAHTGHRMSSQRTTLWSWFLSFHIEFRGAILSHQTCVVNILPAETSYPTFLQFICILFFW